MSFKNVKIIDPYVENGMAKELKLTLSTTVEVKLVENKLNTTFPKGYKEYVTTLGSGLYCGYIQVKMPNIILAENKENQEFLEEYYFWEMGDEILSKERAIESIKIADTLDNDVIIFHPSKIDELFVLPRHDDMLHNIGSSLYEAIDWLCVYRHNPRSGSVGETHQKRYFIPDNPFQITNGIIFPKNT